MIEPSLRTESPTLLGFIVGTPRSGTRWLAESLNRHSEVVAIGETAFWGRKYVQPSNGHVYSREDLELVRKRYRGGCTSTPESRLLTGKGGIVSDVIDRMIAGPSPTPKELFDSICGEIAERVGKRFVIEKTPHHVNWSDRIAAFYPNCKFVITIREPYSFLLSYKHQGDRKDGGARDGFRRVYHPLGAATVYRSYLRSTRRVTTDLSDRAILVPFEELREDSSTVINRIQEFLGLPIENISVETVNSSFAIGARPPLSPEDKFWMNIVAKREILQAGYKVSTSQPSFRALLGSVASIPVWAFRSAMLIRRMTGAQVTRYVSRWLK